MATTTSTIVFVDVVDSTALRTELGEEAADRLLRAHQRALREVVTAHLGRVVSTSGDGTMAAFDSATDAVRAATAVQQSAAGRGVRVRVGLAAGDVSWEDGECFGLPVVTASRLESRAEAGQILVSGLVRLLAGDRSTAEFQRLGPLALKGLPEPVEAFEVPWTPLVTVPSGAPPDTFTVPCPAAVAATPAFAFVGREGERQQLELAWVAALAGERRLVLIGGEAGAGKTRLAFEFARRCHAQGAAVLLGGCDAELGLPYQPWVQVFDHLVRAMPTDVAAGMAGELAEVSVAVPQLERLVPGLRRPSPADPENERYRLFHAVDAVLGDAANRWPTLVLIDDLHWAGAPTLALLRHLVRSATPARMLIVGTFRDTGDEVTEPLASSLADLRRIEAATRLRLGGLDAAMVGRFVANEVGHDLDEGLRSVASVLVEESAGNPFYVGELWRHLVAGGVVARAGDRWTAGPVSGVGVPDSVREVVADRLAKLSPGARRVAELAAVAGQSVELRVLDRALGEPAGDVGAGLDELMEAKLLTEVGGLLPTYQFAHAIVRETVESSVPSSARTRLHRRVAEAYEAAYESDRRPVLVQLARHFTAAAPLGRSGPSGPSGPSDPSDPSDKAVYYLRRAAAQALRSVAYEEAIGHLEIALQLDPPPEDRVDILLSMGEARARHGATPFADAATGSATRQAMAIFADAFRAAQEVGSVSRAAQAAAGFDQALHLGGHPGAPAVEIVSEALTLLGDEDSPLRTRLQSSLARALALAGRIDEAERLGAEALADARRHGDPQVLAAALQCGVIYATDPHRLVDYGRELSELAHRLDDPWAACYGRANWLRGLLTLGQVAEARRGLDELRQTAERGRFVVFRYMAIVLDAVLAIIEGRLEEAERLAERAQEFGASAHSDFDAGVHGLQMFVIRRAQGRLAEVAPVLRLAAALGGETPVWRPGLAVLLAETGMLDEARQQFDRLAVDDFSGIPRDAMWPACLTFLADVCLALGDRARAALLLAALEPFRGRTMMVGFTVCLGPADRLAGRLAALVGRDAEAEVHFQTALELAERSGSPVWQAQVRHDAALALGRALARGERPEPPPAVTGAPVASGAPVGAAALLPDGLSAREVEVLRLVASGMSNREIGARLYISHNTAANHIRSILQKTGSANRAEATAYAARHGLLAS